MGYQALYRQWRPRDFSHMVGQETIVDTLRHQVQTGRVAHAYLFCGSRGTGKTSTAKILARAINCLHPRNGDPCGECEICQRMQSEEFLDILEFDAASNSRVEDARELLEKATFPPQIGRYKVYIIDEVHMLSNSAFNALLKTLEEPPEYLVFILATTEPYKLPATILSRCQRYDFGRIPAEKIQQRLREATEGAGGNATDGGLLTIARAAEGGMRDALSILDMCLGYGQTVDETLVRKVLGTSDRTFLFAFSRALNEENAARTIKMIDELIEDGKDPLIFSRDLSSHFRALLLAKCCGDTISEILGLAGEDVREYLQESENVSTARLMQMLDIFMKLEGELRYSGSPRVALENACLKCCLRTKEADQLALTERIAELEKRITELQQAAANGIKLPAGPEAEAGKAIPRKTEKKQPRSDASASPANSSGSFAAGSEGIWEKALQLLQKTEPGIHGMFRMGKFAGSSDREFRWKANPSFEIIAQSLNTPERKKKIEEALSEAAGKECTFTALDHSQETIKAEEASDEAYVKGLIQTFGEEPVDILDSPEER